MNLRADADMHGVNSIGRQDASVHLQIGRRVAELGSKLIALHHRASQRPGPAKHLSRGVKLPAQDRLTYPRAADRFTIERNGRESMNGEMQLGSKTPEQFHITTATMAEGESAADADAAELAEIPGQRADELLAGLAAERFVELNDPCGLDAKRPDGAQLLRQRIDRRRHMGRRDHGIGMAVEGHDHGERLVLLRVGDGLPDDLLMPEMHAVEHPDGHTNAARAGREIGWSAEDVHAACGA